MKILITGGAGYIGSLLTHKILNNGHSITVVDRHRPHKDTYWIQTELADAHPPKCDVIVHLAWVGTPASTLSQKQQQEKNIHPSVSFLSRVSKANPPHVIFAASAGALYDKSSPQPYTEDSPVSPTSSYGKAKKYLEEWVASEYPGTFTSIRFTNIVSPTQELKANQGIVAAIKTAATSNQPFQQWGNAIKDYIFASDAINAISQLIHAKASGIFNCGSGTTISTSEITEIARDMYKELSVTTHKLKNHDNPNVGVSIHKLTDAIDWRPKYSSKAAIRKSLA